MIIHSDFAFCQPLQPFMQGTPSDHLFNPQSEIKKIYLAKLAANAISCYLNNQCNLQCLLPGIDLSKLKIICRIKIQNGDHRVDP
jgi:hypothetical protein